MSRGQPGDTRKFRALKKTDYYASKAAAEQKTVTSWPKCLTCGQDITGQNFNGYCLHCHNETTTSTGGNYWMWDVSHWDHDGIWSD